MIRNLKVLGLALVAMLTMGIVAASASAVEFHSEAAETTVTGSQEGTNTFVTDSGTIHCQAVKTSGTMSGKTASAIEVSPTYESCRSTGFIEANVTIDANGCKYNVTAEGGSTSAVHITGCNAGASGIVVTAPFCTITVTPQTIGPVHYTTASSGATHEIIFHWTATNITYHESGFACKNGSASNTTGGTFNGTWRWTGLFVGSSFGHVGLTVF